MSLFKKKSGIVNPYDGLRMQALQSKAVDFTQYTHEHEVYAVVIDSNDGGRIYTVACFADGTCSVYYHSGAAHLGMGQKSSKIAGAAKAMVFSSEQVLPVLEVSDDFTLPLDGERNFYLLTKNGVYKAKTNKNTIEESSREYKFLNFLAFNIAEKLKTSKLI